MNDKAIVELLIERDEGSIESAKEMYQNYIFTIANNILQDEEDAKEVVNDTYLKMWNTIPPNKPESLKYYLGMLARGISINKLEKKLARKRGEGLVTVSFDELTEIFASKAKDISDEIVFKQVINDFLETLDRRHRIIFVKRYWYMESIKDIARNMGMTQSSVKISLYRTRCKLKKYMMEVEDDGCNSVVKEY